MRSKPIKRFIAVLLIKYLQRKYKSITEKNIHHNHSNQILNKLRLIQNLLHYFKGEFHAWGYFHPDCGWSVEDEEYFRKLFPDKDFEEIDIVVWFNPEAIAYYQNKIFRLTDGNSPNYAKEIRNQLIKWKHWN